jgi:peptidoglycan/xylan/chitin deacetylase (PgdA/CDA1 family)
MGVNSIVKGAARWAMHSCGGLELVRRHYSGVRILMYHHFAPASIAALERQCLHLRQHYDPVSLDQIADNVKSGTPLPANGIAVTVDDGYQDFRNAHPVFQRYGIPVTVFIVSEFASQQLWLWYDQFVWAMRNTKLRVLELPQGNVTWSGEAQREEAIEAALAVLKRLPARQCQAFMMELPKRLEVAIPTIPPLEVSPLTWTDMQDLHAQGVCFGSHTRTHPILPMVEDTEELWDQIDTPRRRLEQELDAAVLHFCYPNGDWTPQAREAIERSGYRTAVLDSGGVCRGTEDPFLLPRVPADPELSDEPYFRERLAGLHAG